MSKKKNMFKYLMVATLFLLLMGSCDINQSDTFVPETVIEAYLIAGEAMPEVRISKTVPFGTAYVFDRQAVDGATVVIRQLNDNGALVQEHQYTRSSKGIYQPAAAGNMVIPRGIYALEVDVPGNDPLITSTTIVPDTFQILESTGDTVVYLSGAQFEIDVTSSFYPGRQDVFIFSTEAFDIRMDNLTPFQADIFDVEEDSLEDLRINESPPVNEGNFDIHPDGTLTIKLPWLAINFFGDNLISANAIDQNYWDFVRSQSVQGGASTLSPGEIPDIIDNIENGTGLFASFARISRFIYVARPQ